MEAALQEEQDEMANNMQVGMVLEMNPSKHGKSKTQH
jgi:hypothetical protein